MQPKKIIKYAGATVLSAALTIGAGLEIYDHYFDHTKAMCPITKLQNQLPVSLKFPNDSNLYPMGILHQEEEIIKDYKDMGVKAKCKIKKGKVVESVSYDKVIATKTINDAGEEIYSVPEGYLFINNVGQNYGLKPEYNMTDGYILESTIYQTDENGNTFKEKGLTLEFKKHY